MGEHGALIHQRGDDVAVAIKDLSVGEAVKVRTVKGRDVGSIKVIESIPLGHKFSLRDIAQGEEITEYGRTIGRATQRISKGTHVHVHNIRSLRWPS